MTEHQLRYKVVETAKLYLGAKQGDADHKLIVDTYNSHRPLARNYKLKYTDAWCAGFVSAIAIMTEMTDIIPTEVGAHEQLVKFQKLKEWQEDDKYFPKVGDIVYYDWDDSGYGDNQGRADHVGIVESLGTYSFTVIEGNMNIDGVSQVGRREVDYDQRFIRGFGTPDYKSKCDHPQEMYVDTDELNARSIAGMGGKVVAKLPFATKVVVGSEEGDWTYVTVTGYVASQYLSETEPKTSYVTTDNLNLRQTPSMKAKIILIIPSGATVQATGNTEVEDNVFWRQVIFSSRSGWVSSEYLA